MRARIHAYIVIKRVQSGLSWATKHNSLKAAQKAYYKVTRSEVVEYREMFKRDPFMDYPKCQIPIWAGVFKEDWRVGYELVSPLNGLPHLK